MLCNRGLHVTYATDAITMLLTSLIVDMQFKNTTSKLGIFVCLQ